MNLGRTFSISAWPCITKGHDMRHLAVLPLLLGDVMSY